MSNPWQPSPNRGFGPQGFPKPTPQPLHQSSLAQPPSQPQSAGPPNSNLLWILMGVGVCGLFSLCCFSGLLMVYFQRPVEGMFSSNDNSALLSQESNPNLGQYRGLVMSNPDLLRYVGKIESMEFDSMATLSGHDIESVGFKLKGSKLSGDVVVYETVVNGRKVLRKAVFKPDERGFDELWMVF